MQQTKKEQNAQVRAAVLLHLRYTRPLPVGAGLWSGHFFFYYFLAPEERFLPELFGGPAVQVPAGTGWQFKIINQKPTQITSLTATQEDLLEGLQEELKNSARDMTVMEKALQDAAHKGSKRWGIESY